MRYRRKMCGSRVSLASRQRNAVSKSHRYLQRSKTSHLAKAGGIKKRGLTKERRRGYIYKQKESQVRKHNCCTIGRAFEPSPRMGLQLQIQDKHVVLRTSENLSLTWTQTCVKDHTGSPSVLPEMTANVKCSGGTLTSARNAESAMMRHLRGTEAALSPSDGHSGSSDVQMLDNLPSPNGQQKGDCSLSGAKKTLIRAIRNKVTRDRRTTELGSLTPHAGSSGQGVMCTASVSEISDQRGACSQTTIPQGRHHQSPAEECVKVVGSSAWNVGKNAGAAASSLGERSVRKLPLKSKMSTLCRPKRLSHTPRRSAVRKTPLASRGHVRCPSLQWNVSLPPASTSTSGICFSQPVISNVVGGQKAVEMTRMEFDANSSWQNQNNEESVHQLEEYNHAADRQEQVIASPLMGHSHSQQLSAEGRPGCSTECPKSYPTRPNCSLVPTSLTVATAGPSPENTPVSSAGHLTVAEQNMDSVFWTCMSEDVDPSQKAEDAKPSDDNVPVATDMAPVTAEHMPYEGEFADQKVRLAHGYDVFIRRSDLWEAERASKQSWSILTRRLLDIYFDRMTLAMGRASHRGTNEDHKPLDQNVIGAIRAYIKARFNFDNRRKLMQVIGFYCSYCRNKLMHQLQYS
ncbi:uncharacterized protein LOC110988680 isoform X2 [Acanthaster planci]|nr:uncharacterized protein LOC110988680 isoform X2 [Acanthaster planci]